MELVNVVNFVPQNRESINNVAKEVSNTMYIDERMHAQCSCEEKQRERKRLHSHYIPHTRRQQDKTQKNTYTRRCMNYSSS